MPRKKTERAIYPVSAFMPRSWSIMSMAGATMLADMVVTSWLAEQTMPTESLRREGQLYGFAGSSGPSHVTCRCI